MRVLADTVLESNLFHERVAEPLDGAALELALGVRTMNDAPGIEARHEPRRARAPGLLVDLDLERVGAERVVVERLALARRRVDRRRRGRVVLLEHLDGPPLAGRALDDARHREPAIRRAADERVPAGQLDVRRRRF